MEEAIQNQVSLIIGKYGWLFLVGVVTLLFRSTIEKGVAGFMVFMGNDYNEDDVVEVDGRRLDDPSTLKKSYGADMVIRNSQNIYFVLNEIIDVEYEDI